MPADGPPLLPDVPLAFADDGYNPALSLDERDRLQLQHEAAWEEAVRQAAGLQRLLDAHADVTGRRADDDFWVRHSAQLVATAMRKLNACIRTLDDVRSRLLAAASPRPIPLAGASGVMHPSAFSLRALGNR